MDIFRVGTFNVYNLLLPGIDLYRGSTAFDDDEFNDKTDWIGRQLDDMEVDVVGFQEVFHRDALRAALMKSQRFSDVEPVVLATNEDENPARTPAVALASKFPVLESQSITDIPVDARLSMPHEDGLVDVPVTKFSRPVLKAKVQVTPTLVVTVFVAHLKSKRATYLEGERSSEPIHRTLGSARSLIQRAAEAAGLRSLVTSEVRGNRKPVIVLGDVNDGTTSVTTQMIAGEQPFYRLSRDRKAPYWDVLLYTAQQIQARASTRDTYFTHIFNGSFEALDHVMVSEEFYRPNRQRVGQVEYVRVLNDHLLDEVQSFDDVPWTRSDHGQVVVKIRLLN